MEKKLSKEICLQKLMETTNTKDVCIIINNTAKNVKTIYSKQIYQKLIKIKILPPTAINKWVDLSIHGAVGLEDHFPISIQNKK